MDELSITDVDADVRQTPRVGVLEEDQITWLEIAATDRRTGGDLRPKTGADVLAEGVEDDPVGEPGAVEATRSMRRPDIRVTDVLHGVVHDRVSGRVSRGAPVVATVIATVVVIVVAGASTVAERVAGLAEVVCVHVPLQTVPIDRVETAARRAGDQHDCSRGGNGRDAAGEAWRVTKVQARRDFGVVAVRQAIAASTAAVVATVASTAWRRNRLTCL